MAATRWIAGIACFGVAVAVTPSFGAEPFQLPARKAGCWEHTAVQGLFGKAMEGGSTYECVDAASEQARLQSGTSSAGACTNGDTSGAGGRLAWDSICTLGSATTKTHLETSGDFQSGYSITIMSSVARPGSQPQVSKVVANSKWISRACPAGLAPGRLLILGGAPCVPDGTSN